MWHWVVQNLVRRQVKEAVYEAASQAVRQQLHDTPEEAEDSDGDQAAEAAVCDVAVIFATQSESGGLEDLLEDVRRTKGSSFVVAQGKLGGRRVVIAVSGVGYDKARQATSAVILGHKPRWVLSAGFAGGLQSALLKGDIVMVNQIVDAAGKQLTIDLHVDADELRRHRGLHVGRILSIDRLVPKAREKDSLGQHHDALAVDMESFVVAEVCRADRIPFLGIRIISDAVEDELPPEMGVLIQQSTPVRRLGVAFGSLMRRPSVAKDFFRLREQGLKTSDRLAKFLEGVVAQLAPHEEMDE